MAARPNRRDGPALLDETAQARLVDVVLDAVVAQLWLVDLDERILLNRGPLLQRVVHRDPRESLGQTLHEFFGLAADELNQSIDAHRRALAGERVEYSTDAYDAPIDVVIRPLLGPTGEIAAVAGVALDAGDRRRYEAVLRRKSDEVRSLVRTLEVVVWECYPDTLRFTFVSDYARTLLGYPVERWYEPGFWVDHIHPDDREAALRGCREAIAAGSDHRLEYRLIRADDRPVWVRDAVRVESGAPGEPVRVCGVMIDVTAEREARDRLVTTEQRYAQLFDAVGDMVAQLDLDGRLLSMNAAGAAMTGYAVEELIGRRVSELVAPGFGEVLDRQRVRKLAGESDATTYEIEIVRKDGAHRRLEVRSRLLHERGHPIGTHGVARDVTEERHAEQRRQQSQRLEAVGRLAAGVAHDFNNVLTAIRGHAELAWLRPEDAEQQLRRLLDAVERARGFTSQLLTFAARRDVAPTADATDVNDVVERMRLLLARLIESRIDLRLQLAPELAPARIGAVQVEQILLNLALNARDAIDATGTIEVETRVEKAGSAEPGLFVVLGVRDTGCGMTREVLEHAFEPFFTTKGDLGTGLGLATVYGIASRAGGHVTVRSKVGAGTEIGVFIPVADHAPAVAEGQETQPEAAGGRETVLLVDDEEIVRTLLVDVLRQHGYDVLTASDGREALAVAEANDVDLLVTDVVMPGIGGVELGRRIRSSSRGVKVLFLSGYGDEVIAGVGAVADRPPLRKPFGTREFVAAVRAALDAAA